jgi:hypothetical protein
MGAELGRLMRSEKVNPDAALRQRVELALGGRFEPVLFRHPAAGSFAFWRGKQDGEDVNAVGVGPTAAAAYRDLGEQLLAAFPEAAVDLRLEPWEVAALQAIVKKRARRVNTAAKLAAALKILRDEAEAHYTRLLERRLLTAEWELTTRGRAAVQAVRAADEEAARRRM